MMYEYCRKMKKMYNYVTQNKKSMYRNLGNI